MKTFDGLRLGTVLYCPSEPEWGLFLVKYQDWKNKSGLILETEYGYFDGDAENPEKYEIYKGDC